MRMRHPLAALALLASAAVAAPATAQGVATALGEGGTVYRLLAGRCDTLAVCPVGTATANPALALEIELPGIPAFRTLVPETEGAGGENHAAIALDRASGRAFLVWEAAESTYSTLRLASFGGGEWSPTVDVAGDLGSVKRHPGLAVTHDTYRWIAPDGSTSIEHRFVLHLVWWDARGAEGLPLYTAIVVQDGAAVGTSQPLPLLDLLPPVAAGGAPVPAALQAPQIRTVGDGDRAVITLADTTGGRVATLEVGVVSGQLVSFASEARAVVLAIGESNELASRQAIAAEAGPPVRALAASLFAPDVAAFMADRFLAWLAGTEATKPLTTVADEARAEIIDIGRRLRTGFQVVTGEARAEIIDIGRQGGAVSEGPSGHLATFRATGDWPAPPVPDRPLRVLASDDGGDVAVAWELDGAIKYRETVGAGWSDVRTLALGPRLDREQAYALIERHLQQR